MRKGWFKKKESKKKKDTEAVTKTWEAEKNVSWDVDN